MVKDVDNFIYDDEIKKVVFDSGYPIDFIKDVFY